MTRALIALAATACLIAALDAFVSVQWARERGREEALRLEENRARWVEAARKAMSEQLQTLGERGLQREADLRAALLPEEFAPIADGIDPRERAQLAQRAALAAAAFQLDAEPVAKGPLPAGNFKRSALLAALVFVLGGLSLWRTDRERNRRESAQALAIDRLARGESAALPDPERASERALAAAFARLVDAFVAARRDLEERVAQKTMALGQALHESQALNERLQRVLHELEETQAALLQQERMAALGAMAGGIAHEFRNLLGGILGCVQDLKEDLNDPSALETVAVIERAVARGRAIVQGLRQFSVGRSGEPEEIRVQELCKDLQRLLTQAASQADVALTFEAAPQLSLVAERAALEQVLTNLILNALQASPPLATVQLTAERDAAFTLFRVKDRGNGISDEDWARIFEPFFTTKVRTGGSGLGLSVSLGIVRAAGGELFGHPREGGGTEFVVRWPNKPLSTGE